MRELCGKHAVVTGAAAGIGRAIAERLAAEGARLFLVDKNLSGLNDLAAELAARGTEVHVRQCDLANPPEITACNRAMYECWSHVDILINNAGVLYHGPVDRMTSPDWDWLIQINLLAPIQFTRELLSDLTSRPGSHVVNIASMYGLFAMPRTVAYHASKFGLVGFTEGLRAELGRQGVGVTAVCPGFVATDLFQTGRSGHDGREVPVPPSWLCTTPEHVAQKTVQGMLRDRALVVTPMAAHLMYNLKRFAPGLLDGLNRLGRTKRMRRKVSRAHTTTVAARAA